jgi:hypothetical protein
VQKEVVSQESAVNRKTRAVIGLVAIVGLGSGCGASGPAPPPPGQPVIAGGNSRVKFKDEYKKMIGPDGKMLFKPSETNKRPAGVP